jgi:hypothetical protein
MSNNSSSNIMTLIHIDKMKTNFTIKINWISSSIIKTSKVLITLVPMKSLMKQRALMTGIVNG